MIRPRLLVTLLLPAAALSLAACVGTETEVVSAADSVKLMGSRFVHDDEMAHEQTIYTWNEARRGYLDPEGSGVVRFARLKGDAYIAQMQPLKEPAANGRQTATDGKLYLLGLIRVSAPRVHIQSPKCHGLRDESPWLARGYGLELNNRGLSEHLTGSRAGILGYFAAGLECEPGTLDVRLIPEALAPGGPELALAAAKYDRGNFVPYFVKECESGRVETCYKLGQVYARAEGVPKDAARAAALFERVCAARDMRGCLDLGLLYDRGDGVARDTTRATTLIRLACDGGEPYACEVMKARAPRQP